MCVIGRGVILGIGLFISVSTSLKAMRSSLQMVPGRFLLPSLETLPRQIHELRSLFPAGSVSSRFVFLTWVLRSARSVWDRNTQWGKETSDGIPHTAHVVWAESISRKNPWSPTSTDIKRKWGLGESFFKQILFDYLRESEQDERGRENVKQTPHPPWSLKRGLEEHDLSLNQESYA